MWSRTEILVFALALALGPGALGARAEMSVGVAPFERVAAQGHGVPDVAGRLAQRLGTQGVDKVVGPGELGAPALAEPAAHEVSKWAQEAGVSRVVVGRTTRLGNSLSVDARVLDGATGRALGRRIVAEASRPEDLGIAVDSLATQVLARLAESPAPAPPAPPAAAASSAAPAKRKSSGTGPLSIKSDMLEVLDGADKRLLFTGSVRARQEDLLVRSDKLEAFYPRGSSQPDRLVATGNVKLEQEGRIATCLKAVYFRTDRRVVCTGEARVDQTCDSVRGDKITFFLDRESLKVEGAADVQLLDGPECNTQTAASQ